MGLARIVDIVAPEQGVEAMLDRLDALQGILARAERVEVDDRGVMFVCRKGTALDF